MNVIIKIEGREAIPVRAIPLLTDWQVMSPDELAAALAWDEHGYHFHGISAYRMEGGTPQPIRETWWEKWVVQDLQAISERIKATQPNHKVGYSEWRRASLPVLPAGVFVWRDEFEERYLRKFGPRGTLNLATDEGLMPKDEMARKFALDFNPFIPFNLAVVVMEGFDLQVISDESVPEKVGNCQETSKSAPDWTLKRPKRAQGYSEPLYRKLKTAHDGGLPRPTALDVMDAFLKDPHIEVAVVTGEGLKYSAGSGTKFASLDAIRKAIDRMTERPPRLLDDSTG